MLTMLGEERTKAGEALTVEVVTAPDGEYAESIRDLLAHKGPEWELHIRAALDGETDALETRFYLGLLDGRPVANVMTVESLGIGILGHVFTRPEQRRKGICQAIFRRLLQDFGRRDGRVLLLGTGFESAAYWIYHSFGFRSLNGGFMRYDAPMAGAAALTAPIDSGGPSGTDAASADARPNQNRFEISVPAEPALFINAAQAVRNASAGRLMNNPDEVRDAVHVGAEEEFDRGWFAPALTRVVPLAWRHWPVLALLGAQANGEALRSAAWKLRGLGSLEAPVLRTLAALSGGRGTAAVVLETERGAVAGCATLHPTGGGVNGWPGVWLLDAFTHPYFNSHLPELLAGLALPAGKIIAYVDTDSRAKAAALEAAGFEREGTLCGFLRAGGAPRDVWLYGRVTP
ncbi:MAG TPA: GNAT family N-acetyltransferase [Chthonomonadaceae bacterium]|nr:GNAT family N-acetyltransferase [Chthonomonadaceae bacterium]